MHIDFVMCNKTEVYKLYATFVVLRNDNQISFCGLPAM